MARRIRLVSLILTPLVKLFLCRCAVMASLKRTRSVTLGRVTPRHAVIRRHASSGPEPCATRVVLLVAQVVVSLHRERSSAGSPGMTGVICPSFAPVTRQHVQLISLSQTVGTSSSDLDCSHDPLKARAVGLESLRVPTAFAHHWIV